MIRNREVTCPFRLTHGAPYVEPNTTSPGFGVTPNIGAVSDAEAEDEFALSGFPEFVRSGDGFCWDAPIGLEREELTDCVVAGTAAAPRRAASWALVTQTGSGSFGPAPAQSSVAGAYCVMDEATYTGQSVFGADLHEGGSRNGLR
jgi:hypothetical protein